MWCVGVLAIVGPRDEGTDMLVSWLRTVFLVHKCYALRAKLKQKKVLEHLDSLFLEHVQSLLDLNLHYYGSVRW